MQEARSRWRDCEVDRAAVTHLRHDDVVGPSALLQLQLLVLLLLLLRPLLLLVRAVLEQVVHRDGNWHTLVLG